LLALTDRICTIIIDCATLPFWLSVSTSRLQIILLKISTNVCTSLRIKHHGPVILASNFNSHVGSEGGPKASGSLNLHGRLLLQMVCNNDLFITSLSSLSTGPSYTYFKEDTQTITDYIIMDAIHVPMTMDCQIYNHHPLNSSDHLPLSLTISLAPTVSSAIVQHRTNWSATAVRESVKPP